MRRAVLASLFGVTVGVAVSASASSLGVDTAGVGSGAASVVPCQAAALTVGYATSYHSAHAGYHVAEVTVSGFDGMPGGECAFKEFRIMLTGDSGVSLAEIGGTVPDTALSLVADFSAHHVRAGDVTGVYLSIAG